MIGLYVEYTFKYHLLDGSTKDASFLFMDGEEQPNDFICMYFKLGRYSYLDYDKWVENLNENKSVMFVD